MAQGKHTPTRSCICCGNRFSKRDLVRIVNDDQGRVGIDSTGKQNGRGAYLCHDVSCWENGLRRNRLDQVLRITVSTSVKEGLLEDYRKRN